MPYYYHATGDFQNLFYMTKLSVTGIQEAGSKCYSYLLNSINADGSFVYSLNAKTGKTSAEYNILRHAGTVYSLYQWMNFKKETDEPEIMKQSREFLLKHCRQLPNGTTCVVYENEAELGGSALTLVALAERFRSHNDDKDLKVMQHLAYFLIWMQKPSGEFRTLYNIETNEFPEYECIFYHGQSILGLTLLYEIDRDIQWLNAAELGAAFMVNTAKAASPTKRKNDHWFCMALNALYKIDKNTIYSDELLLGVNATVITLFKTAENLQRGNMQTETHSTAAIATKGEAIAAALEIMLMVNNKTEISRLSTFLKEILAYCLEMQVPENNSAYVPKAAGGIMHNRHSSQIRIDYVQHVLSMLIGYLRTEEAASNIKKLRWE